MIWPHHVKHLFEHRKTEGVILHWNSSLSDELNWCLFLRWWLDHVWLIIKNCDVFTQRKNAFSNSRKKNFRSSKFAHAKYQRYESTYGNKNRQHGGGVVVFIWIFGSGSTWVTIFTRSFFDLICYSFFFCFYWQGWQLGPIWNISWYINGA